MKRARRRPYLFVVPFLVLFSLFLVYPLVKSAGLAFQQTFGPSYVEWVGYRNFENLYSDPQFWIAVKNTVIFACGSIFLQLPLSLGLALLLNRPSVKGRLFFRLVFFSPALVGAVFVGVMASVMFEKRTGLVNQALHLLFNFDPDFPWLQFYIMPAMIIASLWMWTGYNMVYFLAALQNVDKELLEAAEIDGANAFHRFWNVTLPAIRPIAGFVVLLSTIGSFQVFELPYLMLGGGSGPDYQGLTVVMYLYQTGFQQGDLGYASAIGWSLAILLICITALQRYLSRKEAY